MICPFISVAKDASGNSIAPSSPAGTSIDIDTRNPELISLTGSPSVVTDEQVGLQGFTLTAIFDEPMGPSETPQIIIGNGDLNGSLIFNATGSQWTETTSYAAVYDVQSSVVDATGIDVQIASARDEAGNAMVSRTTSDVLEIHLTGVGIAENSIQSAVSFGPNPYAQGELLLLHARTALGRCSLRIIDAQGRLIHGTSLNLSAPGSQALHLPQLAAGAYEILVESGSSHHSTRLIVIAR